jgi:hypothetical protein
LFIYFVLGQKNKEKAIAEIPVNIEVQRFDKFFFEAT